MRLGAAPNLSGSAGSTALNTLSLRWLAFVSSSDATVASSVLCAPQLPWPVPRMVVSSCACGFFPLVVANSMANCGKVEKSSHARAQAREPPATFVQNAGLCTTRGSPVVPSASTGSVGDPTSPGGVARVLNPWPVRPARPGAHSRHCALPAPFGALAVRGRLRVLRVSARCACARRPRAGGGIAFVRHMSFLNGRSCTFGKLTPLWTLVRGTSVESRSPSRAAVGDLAVLHRGPGASEPL